MPWIDVYGEALPRNGQAGGDHIIYVDFKKRYKMDKLIREAPEELKDKLRATAARAGIAVIDVEGHDYGAAFIASVFHQAFLLGVSYELRFFGEITTTLFDNINTRFFNSSGIHKTLTMVYGEITERGTFRFLSAAHPPPLVFSNKFDRLVAISEDRLVSFPQIGTMPSRGNSEKTVPLLGVKEKYTVNEISLMGQRRHPGPVQRRPHRPPRRRRQTIFPRAVRGRCCGPTKRGRPGRSSSASRRTCWPSTPSPTTTSRW